METVSVGEDEAYLKNSCQGLISKQVHQSFKSRQRLHTDTDVNSEQQVSDVQSAGSNVVLMRNKE